MIANVQEIEIITGFFFFMVKAKAPCTSHVSLQWVALMNMKAAYMWTEVSNL